MADVAGWNGFAQAVLVIELCIAGYCLYRLVHPFLQSAKVAWAAGGAFILTMLVLFGTEELYPEGLPCNDLFFLAVAYSRNRGTSI